eukprot:GHVO01025759.1.p1 GENE.GHVO01025759.1~~GHVO01025759.1.p1  ORF type:complete len:122 (+),score=3.61 GHVO01025759.1:157-522(+)
MAAAVRLLSQNSFVFRQNFIQCKKYALSANCRSLHSGHSSYSGGLFTTPIPEFEDKVDINSYHDLHRFSIENPREFWGTLAKSRLRWREDFDNVMDCDMDQGKIEWFLNGKLNVAGSSILF